MLDEHLLALQLIDLLPHHLHLLHLGSHTSVMFACSVLRVGIKFTSVNLVKRLCHLVDESQRSKLTESSTLDRVEEL